MIFFKLSEPMSFTIRFLTQIQQLISSDICFSFQIIIIGLGTEVDATYNTNKTLKFILFNILNIYLRLNNLKSCPNKLASNIILML